MKFLLVLCMYLCILKVAIADNSSKNKKCYVCTATDKSQKCEDPFNKTLHTLDICDDEEAVCIKERLRSTANTGDNIQRACVNRNYCKELQEKPVFCEICETEGCNSSVMLVPSFITLTSFLFKYLL